MIPRKNLPALQLTPEQATVYKDLERRYKALQGALIRCGVYYKAIPRIIEKSDLMQVDTENPTALDAHICNSWAGLITKKRGAGNEYNGE